MLPRILNKNINPDISRISKILGLLILVFHASSLLSQEYNLRLTGTIGINYSKPNWGNFYNKYISIEYINVASYSMPLGFSLGLNTEFSIDMKKRLYPGIYLSYCHTKDQYIDYNSRLHRKVEHDFRQSIFFTSFYLKYL